MSTTEPCTHCGTTIRHTQRVGCCSACGRLFSGITAFDAHQRFGGNGLLCLDPEQALTEGGKRRFKSLRVDPTRGNGVLWGLESAPSPWPAMNTREQS